MSERLLGASERGVGAYKDGARLYPVTHCRGGEYTKTIWPIEIVLIPCV